MHLIIVDEELEYYNHIHPQFSDGTFTITTQFSEEGRYHLYLDFQPVGAREQQFGFTVNVGRDIALDVGYRDRHTDRSKTFGDYHVELSYPQPLLAAELSEGRQKLTFTITDKEDQPVKTLKPYLGAFGHMVMINQETYDFLHVHPTKIAPREPNATGGPAVAFSPMPLYGEIKPGYYKVFAQFNPDGKLFTADFVVEVE